MTPRNSATVLHSDFYYPSYVYALVIGAYGKTVLRPVALLRTQGRDTGFSPNVTTPPPGREQSFHRDGAFSHVDRLLPRTTPLGPSELVPLPHNATWANVARLAATCAVAKITKEPAPSAQMQGQQPKPTAARDETEFK